MFIGDTERNLCFLKKVTKTGVIDREQSYQLPSFGIINALAKYNFTIAGLRSSFNINIYNVANKKYATEGWDNATRDADGEYNHSQENFMGFWGYERNFNFALKINF